MRSRPCRGQAGLTMVELLMFIAIGAIVLVPVFGLLNQTLLRRQPTVDAAQGAKELRLFRNQLADDWVQGEVVRVNAPDPVGFEFNCNGVGGTGDAAAIKIAIRVSNETATLPNDDRRVLYKLVPAPAGSGQGPYQLLRGECQHRQSPFAPYYLWGFGSDVGSTSQVLVSKVAELRLPAVCNPDYEPYSPCDMNVTLVLANGDWTTVRLYQPVGRRS